MHGQRLDSVALKATFRGSRLAEVARSVPGLQRTRFALIGVRHLIRRAFGRRTIVSLGDSHCQIVAGESGMVVTHLGPVTMHRAGRPGEMVALIDQWSYQHRKGWTRLRIGIAGSRDVILLSFGEIDIRCHVGKQLANGRVLDEIIETLVTAYIRRASELGAEHGCRVAVLGIVPPSDLPGNESFPVVGTIGDRLLWTHMFNESIRHWSEKNGIHFVAIPSSVANEHGCLRRDLSDGNVHLGGAAAVRIMSRLLRDELRKL
jgi:hypothetical protein